MKIAQINLGMIEIPPKSWGAIEKVIWNYKLELEKLGHTVDVVFPWELYENGKLKYDIVHFHVANQSIDTWNDSNLPYVFSIHDHHVVRYGKSSSLYANNLIAMKKSVASITYAEMLVDYFDTTDKLFYIPHGVDTSIYRDYGIKHKDHKLLCVANNGYADDQSYDRKGFRFAIEAARELDLPLTIVGPNNNENFFNVNKDLLEYKKLSFIKNPNEKELIDIYNDHTIFLHPSELEAGHPNLTLLESLSCGVPIVGTFSGKSPLPGLLKCIRNSNDVKNKIQIVIDDYDNYKKMALETAEKYSWTKVVKKLNDFYTYVVSVQDNFTKEDMKKHVLDSYMNTEKLGLPYKEPKMTYDVNFNNGAFFQMNCLKEKNIRVDFIDKENNNSVFGLNMTSNRWAKPNTTYFKNWKIKVDGDDQRVFDFNLKGKNVLISFQSSSLGDNIAWIPYVEEFRKKHNCIMYCSTFQNPLFINEYKNVIFINPGQPVDNLYATYEIGWFSPPWGGKRDQHPNDYRLIPLQQTITDILGLEYEEIIPKITVPDKPRPFNFKEKYVVIAEHSTAQAKYWNYPNGWQILVEKLKELGYKVVVISKQGTALKGIINETGEQSLEKRINQIKHSEFMITIGSGLAWVAWAVGKKVVMISGFSKPFCEFKSNCIRIGGTEEIYNEPTCFGCFNDRRYDFDKGDWWWCPAHKDTPRAYECTKKITPEMVMEEMKKNNLI
jgi:autotransporter strand-loop-strand O-heptosyltransferase